MTRAFAATLGLLLLGVAGFESSPIASAQTPAGSTTLFDGTNLDRWNPVGTANWSLADDAVQADSGSGFLVSKESYADFELRLEFWVTPDANSGVFIRCSDPNQVTATNSYEVNIFDMRPDQTYRTGGIVNVAGPMSVINTGNRWNTYEITARGPRLTVRLNDMPMVDVKDMSYTRGPIALQYGAGVVRFRNVQIR